MSGITSGVNGEESHVLLDVVGYHNRCNVVWIDVFDISGWCSYGRLGSNRRLGLTNIVRYSLRCTPAMSAVMVKCGRALPLACAVATALAMLSLGLRTRRLEEASYADDGDARVRMDSNVVNSCLVRIILNECLFDSVDWLMGRRNLWAGWHCKILGLEDKLGTQKVSETFREPPS